jgi:hypothetical protein
MRKLLLAFFLLLVSSAAAQSIFVGYQGGDCGSNPACTVSMASALTVQANFRAPSQVDYWVDGVNGSNTYDGTQKTHTTGNHGPWKTHACAVGVSAAGSGCTGPIVPSTGNIVVHFAGNCQANPTTALGCTNPVVYHLACSPYSQNGIPYNNVTGKSLSARLIFQSDVKWGAQLHMECSAASWTQDGDYVDIVNFDFAGDVNSNNSGVTVMSTSNIEDNPTTGAPGLITQGKLPAKCHIAKSTAQKGTYPDGCGSGNYTRYIGDRWHDVAWALPLSPDESGSQCWMSAVNMSSVSHDFVVDQNVFLRIGSRNGCAETTHGQGGYGVYCSGYRCTITNSLFVGGGSTGVSLYHNTCQNIVAYNTFINMWVAGIEIAGDDFEDYYHFCDDTNYNTPINNFNTIVNNAAIYDGYGCSGRGGANGHGTGGIKYSASAGSGSTSNRVEYNYFQATWNDSCTQLLADNTVKLVTGAAPPMGNSPWNNINGGVTVSPNLFVNYQSDGTGDYHLKAGSPLIAAGKNGTAICAPAPGRSPCLPLTDIMGNPRVNADIGAYAY